MALELLAGPFTITNKLAGVAVARSISGYPVWIDGRGLALPITNEGIYLAQLDGAAYLTSNDTGVEFGLALQGAGGDPNAGVPWYSISDFGEWDIDIVTLYKGAQTNVVGVVGGRNYVRLHDRYIYPQAGRIYWSPLDFSADWAIEAEMSGLVASQSVSWSAHRSEIVVGTTDGRVVHYDWVAKAFSDFLATIGMSCKGLWWSAMHGAYLSLHDNGSALEIRVWASTVQPASVGSPTPDEAITSGRRTRIRARVLGANADPCEGEVVAWSLTGVGTLTSAASLTDADGYAATYYEAPLDSASAAIEITAGVAI